MTAVLEVSSIKKSFGGIKAVDGVSFDVQEGEILGLIGPNGCGKSTLFNCILGQLTPTGGEVKVDGKVVTGLRPSELNRLGVSRTFQLLQVFPKLSVRDNLILAGQEQQHNMEFVMSLCTRVMVMAEGKLLAMGTPAEVRANPAVIEAYLGH